MVMKRNVLACFALAVPVTMMTGTALLQEGGEALRSADDTFTYFGELQWKNQPYTGTADLRFTLWTHAENGEQIASEQFVEDVMVIDGMFQARLNIAQAALEADNAWLEIAVRTTDAGDEFTTLSPRQSLARRSNEVREDNDDVVEDPARDDMIEVDPDERHTGNGPGSVDDPGEGNVPGEGPAWNPVRPLSSLFPEDPDDIEIRIASPSPWTSDSNGIHYDGGNVGIGEDSRSDWTLRVQAGAGENVAVFSRIDSTNGWAYFSRATGEGGRGIFGTATHPTGKNFGVYGAASGDEGRAVFGWAKSTTGSDTAGGYFQNDSTSSSAMGVYGHITSTSPGGASAAVRGENSGTGTQGIGVWASQDGDGWGVYATVQGDSSAARAVYGYSQSSTGVGRGVYGRTGSDDGYAGYFEGGRNYFENEVGIGTESPTRMLHVSGGSGSGSTGTTGIRIDAVGNNGGLDLRRDNNLSFLWSIREMDGTLLSDSHYGFGGDRLYFTNNGTSNTTGVYLDDGDNAWTSTSDRRLKDNIRDVTYGLNEVMALRPRDFVWKDNGRQDTGFIAQEVFEAFPQAASVPTDDEPHPEMGEPTWGVTYDKFTPLLVAAIQDLALQVGDKDAEIEAQKDEINALHDRLADLEALVAQLVAAQEGAQE